MEMFQNKEMSLFHEHGGEMFCKMSRLNFELLRSEIILNEVYCVDKYNPYLTIILHIFFFMYIASKFGTPLW